FHPEAEAGGLLTRLMQRVGIEREEFTVANAVWQRPPQNRLWGEEGEPLPWSYAAIDYWKPALLELVEEMQPRVIIGLGKTALLVFTGFGEIGQMRGYVHHARIATGEFETELTHELNIPFLATYHPAGLNRGQRHLSGVFIHDMLVGLD